MPIMQRFSHHHHHHNNNNDLVLRDQDPRNAHHATVLYLRVAARRRRRVRLLVQLLRLSEVTCAKIKTRNEVGLSGTGVSSGDVSGRQGKGGWKLRKFKEKGGYKLPW